MIPKIIHYCWFGKGPLPADTIAYIEGWKELNPDYEIMRWDETNFPIDLCDYSREAYEMKEWAFVADVARLYALSMFGGIYLDTDVELLAPLDTLLSNRSFLGMEYDGPVFGIIGAEKGCEWVKIFLDFYRNRHFINIFGKPVRTPNPVLFRRYILLFLSYEEKPAMYPREYFYPPIDLNGYADIGSETMAVHHYAATWRKRRTLLDRIRIMAKGFKVRWM